MKNSKVEVVNLSGGLIGLLGTNPKKAINDRIEILSRGGWHCHQIMPYSTRNVAALLFQTLVLCLTLGLWTFGAGFMLLFHKDSDENAPIHNRYLNAPLSDPKNV